ncbi:phytanoyl-CoA dioxygenase family protein [Paenibacillus sp. GCM10023248]|uniref:phytanoyl-CoA dioxygenase family protein n=1 Tax=unclassified Paenibacillus TaxID=185978 RepID=UPI00237814D1|nr:phytanoyl-CoA dioxygenase family protein [Paenibacillus sp. MAHUQ-63]MDD9267310.1 phytanoyl-CoA dioxygenase family protein [Paenibacillus sp. MAHUQ-63]
MSSVISPEHIAFYEQNGFVQVDGILLPAEIEELTSAMEEAMSERSDRAVATDESKGAYYRVLNQKVNVWRDHGTMAKYSLHARIAEAAKALSGASGVRLFHDHALWKMPQDSKPTPWHQDLPYWPMNEPGALSAWIPLDDVDERNGCMMFIPGSHQAGKLAGIDLVNPQNIFDFVQGTEHEQAKPVIVPLKKGSCTFHHGQTFHYAHANLTSNPRRVLAIIYMPDGTTYSGKKHLVTDGLGLLPGNPIKGGTFPLLA